MIKKMIENINFSNLSKIFIKNFLLGGFVLGSAIAIIELIYTSTNLINFYAFICASFFLYEIPTYLEVRKRGDPNLTNSFLVHSIYGSAAFFLYTIFLWYLNKKKLSKKKIIIITCSVYLIVSLIYFFYQLYINYYLFN